MLEEAENGEKALKKIQSFNPDVILLDIMMPNLTGDELVKTVKLGMPKIKVIMITAGNDQEIKAECIKNGAFACLDKPFNLKDLFSTINKSLEQATD